MRKLLLVLIMIASAAGCSKKKRDAQDQPASADPAKSPSAGTPGTTVHRETAGTPDAEGWFEAVSTNGKFRVLVPAPFNDVQDDGKTEEGKPLVTHTIGAVDAAGARYTTTCFVGGKAVSLPDLQKKFSRGVVTERRPIDHHGMKGFHITTTVRGRSAVMRVLEVKPGAVCLLVVEAGSSTPPVPEAVARFMDSFELR